MSHCLPLICTLPALVLPFNSPSHGEFIGLSVEFVAWNIGSDPDSFMVVRLVAEFTNATDRVVMVYEAEIDGIKDFVQMSQFDGAVAPAILPHELGREANADSFDSWVSLGLPTNGPKQTGLLPAENAPWQANFLAGELLGPDAAWFNWNPPNGQGDAGNDHKVELAQFAFQGPFLNSHACTPAVWGSLNLVTNVGHFNNEQFAAGHFLTCIPDSDLNHNLDVDVGDLAMLRDQWGQACVPVAPCADFNFDGIVDGWDLGFMLREWHELY
jgi:hypothetical protein